jgi:NAD(P)-dependent dehydrogenase (short-subunit alcohol dehydrogenase family)
VPVSIIQGWCELDRVRGKVAIVTGAVGGIGRAVCKLLAEEGAKVAITDLRDENGKKVVQQIRKGGGVAEYWHLDVSKEREVAEVIPQVHASFGGIHVLVNNAGIAGVNRPTHEITEGEWDQVMNVNLKGVFFCTKHTIPFMQQGGGGSIINMSSIYGLVGNGAIPPYNASKGAVRIMTKTDALLYAKDKIRVNSIHPGWIWHEELEAYASKAPQGKDAFIKEVNGYHPIGHVGLPEDIAYAILYLASDESKFATGSELVVDGGYSCR